MAKSNTVKDSINTVGKGILDSLQNTANDTKDDMSKIDNDPNNIEVNTDKSKRVNKPKAESKEKNKRSFMLSDVAIQQLKVLNIVTDQDLSEIVNVALDDYFKKNKKKVGQFLDDLKGTL